MPATVKSSFSIYLRAMDLNTKFREALNRCDKMDEITEMK
jgi:hypothetical protein